jgi:uncharacterized protein YcnI
MSIGVVRRAAVIAAGVAVGALAFALPASAHVTVNPKEATQGGYTKLTFRVPNEKPDASTKAVEVAFPEDTPIASVSYKPMDGWTVNATKTKLDKPVKTDDGDEIKEAVTRVTWTASSEGTQIKPGQFQEFDVSVGPLPEKDKVLFKALQTYSDGEVVRWIDEKADAEHPALALTLTKAASGSDHHGAVAATTGEGGGSHDDSHSGTAIGLGIAGLIAGLAGLVLGGLAFARTRRS